MTTIQSRHPIVTYLEHGCEDITPELQKMWAARDAVRVDKALTASAMTLPNGNIETEWTLHAPYLGYMRLRRVFHTPLGNCTKSGRLRYRFKDRTYFFDVHNGDQCLSLANYAELVTNSELVATSKRRSKLRNHRRGGCLVSGVSHTRFDDSWSWSKGIDAQPILEGFAKINAETESSVLGRFLQYIDLKQWPTFIERRRRRPNPGGTLL